jgi:hypothetical protein
MNLYDTGLPETGFRLAGFVILTVRFVVGEASKNCDFWMDLCLTYLLRRKLVIYLQIGLVSSLTNDLNAALIQIGMLKVKSALLGSTSC